MSLSEVLADNLTKRIDSEYFRKQFLDFFKNVKNINPLSYFVKEGYRVVYENTKIIDATIAVEKQYPIFLQAIDLKTPFIKTNNFCYVHNDEWIRYPKGRIKNGEILIEVKGKVEKVAIVPNDFPEKALVTGSLFKLSVNQNINKHVLLTYLISSYGVAFKDRYKTNLLISFISKPDLYRIPVPNFSKYFQSQIDTLFISIFSFETESKSLYAEAESLLLQEIGLNDFVPSTDNINVKSFADSFGTSGRLDAEYYQPKYEDYEKTVFLKSDQLIRDNFDLIKTVRKIKKSYHYIEIGDIDVSTGSASYNVVSREELPTNAKIMAQKGDLLVSKVRPNRGAVAIIDFEVDELIVSGAFTVLRAKKNANFSCQLLQVLLRTSLYKDWLLKFNIGTQYPVIKDDDILSLPIPKLEISTQNKIKNNIREAQLLQNKSERLLEVAKQAVEIAIEQDENVATTFIDKNHNFVNQEI